MFSCHVHCQPWDLLTEGIEAVLDLLQGQLGAGGLTLPVVCGGPQHVFRPHQNAIPRVHSSAAGVFFSPQAQRYRISRLDPPVANEGRRRDVLALACEHCADRGLELRAAVQPLLSARLAARHSACARKNLFGQASPRLLCPSNPDVQAYVLALAGDLSTYDGVGAIVLDLSAAARSAEPCQLPASLGQGLPAELLNLCFCESCLQLAAESGVDSEAALRAACARMNRCCDLGPAAGALQEDPALTRYHNGIQDRVRRLLRDFRRAAAKPVVLFEPDAALLGSTDEQAAERLLVREPDGVRGETGNHLLELAVHFDHPAPENAAQLVQAAAGAVAHGFVGLTVVHYGAVCAWQFEWIRQAVRHARRLGGEATGEG